MEIALKGFGIRDCHCELDLIIFLLHKGLKKHSKSEIQLNSFSGNHYEFTVVD